MPLALPTRKSERTSSELHRANTHRSSRNQRENTHFLLVLGGSLQQMSVSEQFDRMYFSVFGKHISITIPRNNPPVENGRGVTWENTVATTPNFNFTFRNFVSWCHLLFSKGGKALLSANSLKQPERSIVLERNDGDDDELLGQEPQGIWRTSLASDRRGVECRSADDFTLLDARNSESSTDNSI